MYDYVFVTVYTLYKIYKYFRKIFLELEWYIISEPELTLLSREYAT